MKYEIGQKVETPLGVGKVVGYHELYDIYLVDLNDEFTNKQFKEYHLKPYKSPHDKLLSMGFEEKIHDKTVERETKNGDYKQYVKYPFVILIDLNRKDFTTYTLYNDSKNNVDDVSWVSLELSRILTEYLEWLEEEK